jgi:hypothetical protein
MSSLSIAISTANAVRAGGYIFILAKREEIDNMNSRKQDFIFHSARGPSMKAILQLNLKVLSSKEGQRILLDLCEKMKREGLIDEYRFEITTPGGPITEKCLLSDQKVIA